MRAIGYITAAIACGVFSTAANGATSSETKKCVDALVAQELGTRAADVRIRQPYVPPMPLVLKVEMPVELTMVDKSTGRTLATAECDPRRGLVDVESRDR